MRKGGSYVKDPKTGKTKRVAFTKDPTPEDLAKRRAAKAQAAAPAAKPAKKKEA